MAFVRPLYNDGNDLREMSIPQISLLQQRAVYAYGSSPSALLTVVGSSGSLGSMTDTRLQAGAQSTSATSTPSQSTTADPTQATPVVFDKISQSNQSVSTPTDTNNKLYPVYYDGTDIRAMSATDVFDTFITQAIGMLVDGTDRGGTFRIHNATSLSSNTLVDASPVFTDTRANTGAYSASSIPETLDQPFDVENYYLFKTNQTAAVSITQPVQITSSNDLQTYPLANLDAMFLAELRHHTVNTSGSRITYSINGTGANRGTGMVDTRLDGTNYQTRFVNADDYRAQEFPGGSPQTVNTYFLKITRS